MRPRRFIRSLALAGALVALSVPVFTVTQGAHQASACSNPNCVITIVGPGSGFDTYISPLTATLGNFVFETATQAEPSMTATVTVPGSIDFAVYDLRGNNQGFSAYLSCASDPCFTSVQGPYGIPASALSVSGATTGSSYLFLGDGIGPIFLEDATGALLNHPVLVGGECRRAVIGMGLYYYTVPIALTLRWPYNEYVTLPISWDGNFALTVVENQYDASRCAAAVG